MQMRRMLAGVAIAAVVLLVAGAGAVAVDFATSIYAEYRLSRAVRAAADLGSDPFVAILGFPFIPQAMREHYDELEIKANAVDHAMVGKATLEATMHSIGLADSSWLIGPNAKLPVGKLESRIIIDSVHLGRYMGIADLMVEAPSEETNDATGGTTESGISGSRGLVFTGTPKSANFDKRVSVSVDLSIAGADNATLVFTPTGILTALTPPTRRSRGQASRCAQRLQQAAARPETSVRRGPTSQGVRGSDVIVEGITEGVTITLDAFRQS
ncbi:hypothetical protein I553_5235 [Mycobacterium xenopi 4042]|uniref:DUF2993 domain-containing protein n=1 Tax=Mycobacterium xenopi 4042 TaxID=1299334 RepID=X7ZXM3_MYCXE|nr:hypothetical protein I553_5235 [Mycobacterium xenopi 4042]